MAIDCAEPEALCRWGQGLFGGAFDGDGDASLIAPCVPRLEFLRVPHPKTVKGRPRLDRRTSDLEVATQQVLAHGAVLALDVYAGESWVVLRDPEGNEFCLVRPRAKGAPARRTSCAWRDAAGPHRGRPGRARVAAKGSPADAESNSSDAWRSAGGSIHAT